MPAYTQLLVILVAIVAFWVIVMRPARNQQRKVADLQSQLSVGQEVVLSSGIFGTVRSLSQARVEVEIAPGVVITVARQVVVRRVDELVEEPHQPLGSEEHGPAGPDGPAGPTGPAKAED